MIDRPITVDQEIASIEAVQQTDNTAYWKSGLPDRYGELIAAKEAGTPAPARPSANAQRIAEIEKLMAEPQNSSKYWHDPEMQREYLDLISHPPGAMEAVGGRSSEASDAEPVSEVAAAWGVSEEHFADYQSRVDSAFAGLDTVEMESAYEGLSDEAQSYGVALLLHPDKLKAYEAAMPEAVLEELKAYEAGMTPEEHAALKRALLLS